MKTKTYNWVMKMQLQSFSGKIGKLFKSLCYWRHIYLYFYNKNHIENFLTCNITQWFSHVELCNINHTEKMKCEHDIKEKCHTIVFTWENFYPFTPKKNADIPCLSHPSLAISPTMPCFSRETFLWAPGASIAMTCRYITFQFSSQHTNFSAWTQTLGCKMAPKCFFYPMGTVFSLCFSSLKVRYTCLSEYQSTTISYFKCYYLVWKTTSISEKQTNEEFIEYCIGSYKNVIKRCATRARFFPGYFICFKQHISNTFRLWVSLFLLCALSQTLHYD